MARKPGAGRKPAKNEVASALIAAIKFGSVLKTPTSTSIEQAHFVWLNSGMAVMFDGIVAAGHPIPPDVAGYPQAKLLLDALDNTDKNFTWTIHEGGAFEINSERYSAIIPALAYDKVIPTVPDPRQAAVGYPDAMLAAFSAILKVTHESGDIVLYSSARFTGDSVMGTNGAVILEVREPNRMPNIIVPRQFLAAVVKSGKKPISMGMGVDWKTFTIWFEDGAWLRTNVYDPDAWPSDAINLFYNNINDQTPPAEISPKLWAAIEAVLPFADDDGRVIIRKGIVRTHPDRSTGAALEVKEVLADFDVVGKQFLALKDIATSYTTAPDASIMRVYGQDMRGMVAGLPALAEPPAKASQWETGVAATNSPQSSNQGGWGEASDVQMMEPEGSADLNPTGKWKNGPEPGTGTSAEFKSQYHGIPEEVFEIEDSFIFKEPGDMGIQLPSNQAGFTPSGWLNNVSNADGGLSDDDDDDTNETNNGGW